MKLPVALTLLGGVVVILGSMAGRPGAVKPPAEDPVGVAFSQYESAWRDAQRGLAERLERGEITTESEATKWFGSANAAAMKAAFQPLVDSEYEVFGGDKWTAASHAKHIRRYCRE